MRHCRGSVFRGSGDSHALYLQLLVGAVLFIFYALIFIGEDVKELRDNRGQFTAEHPIAEQKNSSHLADTPKNENGRNDIS